MSGETSRSAIFDNRQERHDRHDNYVIQPDLKGPHLNKDTAEQK